MISDCFRVSGQDRVLEYLSRLTTHPPRVLLLEGGTAGEREKLGLYWTAMLNCDGAVRPCKACMYCRQIQDQAYLDLHYLDGRAGRIGIDAVRELRSLLGQAPRSGRKRVIVLGEAQELTSEAANALLKSMEETDFRNHFILLAAQRERLLPTLVSRSWVLTLAWVPPGDTASGGNAMDEQTQDQEWLDSLSIFLQSGNGWFGRTMVKSQVDRNLAFALIHATRREVIKACKNSPDSAFSALLHENGGVRVWRNIDLRLDEAEEALRAQVAPVLVLDWLAAGMRQSLKSGCVTGSRIPR